MKRYLLFVYNAYDPQGGLLDCEGMSNDLEKIKKRAISFHACGHRACYYDTKENSYFDYGRESESWEKSHFTIRDIV